MTSIRRVVMCRQAVDLVAHLVDLVVAPVVMVVDIMPADGVM